MNLLYKALRACLAILRQPRLLGTVLHTERYWMSVFKKRYEHAHPLPVVELSYFVPDEAEVPHALFLGGGSTIPDLLLLRYLASREECRMYFEIGTWRGESMNAILPFVEKAFSLELDQRSMDTLGYSPQMQGQVYTLLEQDPRIVFLKGDSSTFDFTSVGEKCDLIFIDGNHTYEYVRSDTRNVLTHLTHPGSIIVWHDYAIDPEQIRWEVYQGILDALPATLHRHLFHVSHTKCAILWPGETIPARKAEFPISVESQWRVRLSRLNP